MKVIFYRNQKRSVQRGGGCQADLHDCVASFDKSFAEAMICRIMTSGFPVNPHLLRQFHIETR